MLHINKIYMEYDSSTFYFIYTIEVEILYFALGVQENNQTLDGAHKIKVKSTLIMVNHG